MVMTAVKLLLVVFAVWWIVTSPDSAAHIADNIGSFSGRVADSLSRFITRL
jgi:hypothetical protein